MITSSYSIIPPHSSRLNNLSPSIRSLESPLATDLIQLPVAKQSIPLHTFKHNKHNKHNNHNNHTHYYPHYNIHLDDYNNHSKRTFIPTSLTPYVQKIEHFIVKLFKLLTNMYMFIGLIFIIFILIVVLVNRKNKLIKLSELVTKLKI